MGDDVRPRRLTLGYALLLFVVVAVVSGLVAVARGASPQAAVVGGLVVGAAFVRLALLLLRWRGGRWRGRPRPDRRS